MRELKYPNQFDWHGCPAVQFDPAKLSGRATVLDSRLDADTVLLNHQSGMSAEEIVEQFDTDLQAVRTILAFAQAKQLKAIA